jgi:hypothetical protein
MKEQLTQQNREWSRLNVHFIQANSIRLMTVGRQKDNLGYAGRGRGRLGSTRPAATYAS